jgi:hypothetical protein
MNAHVQRPDSVVKTTIVLKEYTTEEHCEENCVFLWTKGLCTKDIHKEMLPVYGGKCLSLKGVHNWVEKYS